MIQHGKSDSSNAAGSSGRLPRRPYGRTGVGLSVIGMGGIVVMDTEQAHANRTVAMAVERGVNYFDVAPEYGNAEERLGPALAPCRKDCFLACKADRRDSAGAREQLRRSLERLRTDHFDLYQLHGLTDLAKDVDVAFSKGGAMEVLTEARRSGQVRFLGFSAHSEAAALAAMDRFDFDSILFPVNYAAWLGSGLGPAVLDAALRKDMAVLALKALARQVWPAKSPDRKKYRKCWYEPITDRAEAALALRFAFAQGITAAVPPGEEELFRLALDLASDLRPLSEDETNTLRRKAEGLKPILVG